MSFKYLKGVKNNNDFGDQVLTHMGSWADNYNSWKEFKKYKKYILIKYEDLVSEPKKTFLDVLRIFIRFLYLRWVKSLYKIHTV